MSRTIHGVGNHWVKAEDFDALLGLLEAEKKERREDQLEHSRELRDAYAEGEYNARNSEY